MSKEKTPMITPNRLELATTELQGYNLGNFEIPKKIKAAEKDYYVVIGLSAIDTREGLGKLISPQTRFYNRREWARMEKDLASKNPMFKTMCNDQFNKVVILHNPSIPQVENTEKVKALSPTHKGKANSLKEEGASLEEIAKELGVELERVEAHFSK